MVDKECPYVKFDFWDAMISHDGDYECRVESRPKRLVDEFGNEDYCLCDTNTHSDCKWYKEMGKLEKKSKE